MIDLESAKESALYIIDKIRPEIEKGNFRAVYRRVQYLEALVRFATICEERDMVGQPIIKIPGYEETS